MSDKYSVRRKDFIRGLLIACIVPAIYVIQASIDAGEFTFKWKQVSMAAISGGLAYLLKNFFTDSYQEAKTTIEKVEAKKDT